ncbi:MAG: hypothetical protein CL572_04950 [Alphaproteobacteria bacterium]|nr:hypothetical protein [Alphaproteobacteria bacterium]
MMQKLHSLMKKILLRTMIYWLQKRKLKKLMKKKGSQQIIKEKLDEKQKTVIDNKAKEVKVPKKVAKKKIKEKNYKKKNVAQTIYKLHEGLKKINQNSESFSNMTQKLINDTYNTEKMLNMIIGDVWKRLENKKKKEMIDIFEEYIAKNYIKRFSKIENLAFEDLGEKKVGAYVMVKSNLILSDEEKVSINYLLSPVEQDWKIFDVLLAGSVSEIATKKSEFKGFIKKDNIDQLILALKKKNKQLLK